jgi:hypothetical protein
MDEILDILMRFANHYGLELWQQVNHSWYEAKIIFINPRTLRSEPYIIKLQEAKLAGYNVAARTIANNVIEKFNLKGE